MHLTACNYVTLALELEKTLKYRKYGLDRYG